MSPDPSSAAAPGLVPAIGDVPLPYPMLDVRLVEGATGTENGKDVVLVLPAGLGGDVTAGLSEDDSAGLRGDAQRRRPVTNRPDRRRCRIELETPGDQVRVSSATAFLAQRSSTRPLPSAAAAIRAAVAALLSARGSPLA